MKREIRVVDLFNPSSQYQGCLCGFITSWIPTPPQPHGNPPNINKVFQRKAQRTPTFEWPITPRPFAWKQCAQFRHFPPSDGWPRDGPPSRHVSTICQTKDKNFVETNQGLRQQQKQIGQPYKVREYSEMVQSGNLVDRLVSTLAQEFSKSHHFLGNPTPNNIMVFPSNNNRNPGRQGHQEPYSIVCHYWFYISSSLHHIYAARLK